MSAHEALAGPGAIAHEINATRDAGDGGFGKLQPHAGQEFDDLPPCRQRRLSVDVKQDEIVDISAVALDAQLALDEMIERIEVDQRIKLAQQIADGNADWLAVIGEQHH